MTDDCPSESGEDIPVATETAPIPEHTYRNGIRLLPRGSGKFATMEMVHAIQDELDLEDVERTNRFYQGER
jgi:hypothetical protein